MSKKIKLIFPDEVTQKVKTLCESIDYTEWSGILFYSVEGSILKPEEMVLEAKDIILMDKGTVSATGFSFSEKSKNSDGFEDAHIDYCEENEEALLWKIGMIHSHHSMKSFFSSTDLEDLKNNSKLSNYYLSVVVNNDMDFVGKLAINTFLEEEIEVKSYALDDEGNKYHFGNSKIPVKKEFMVDYDCEIDYNKNIKTENSFWFRNIINILTKKDKKSNVKSTSKRFNNFNMFSNPYYNNYYKNDWGSRKNTMDSGERFKKNNSKVFQSKAYEYFQNSEEVDEEILKGLIEVTLLGAVFKNGRPLFNIKESRKIIDSLNSSIMSVKDLEEYLKDVLEEVLANKGELKPTYEHIKTSFENSLLIFNEVEGTFYELKSFIYLEVIPKLETFIEKRKIGKSLKFELENCLLK